MSTIAPEGKEMKNRLVLYKNALYCQENTGLWNGPEKVTFGGMQYKACEEREEINTNTDNEQRLPVTSCKLVHSHLPHHGLEIVGRDLDEDEPPEGPLLDLRAVALHGDEHLHLIF